jgi:hypothetical protein
MHLWDQAGRIRDSLKMVARLRRMQVARWKDDEIAEAKKSKLQVTPSPY